MIMPQPQVTYAAPQPITYAAAPAAEFVQPAYTANFGAGPSYTVGPTYGQPSGYSGGGAYTQGKVYQPVLFTQESFLAYQTQGAEALLAPEASVIEIAAVAESVAPAKAPDAPVETKPAAAPAKKAKKSSKA